MLPLLYTAELDLAPEDVDPFLQWYAFRHAPDLFPLGFMSCACYRVLEGDMNLFDIYEIPGNEIFADPRYAQMSRDDPYADEILAKRRNKAHTIYTQRMLSDSQQRSGATLDADWVWALRFDTEDLAAVEALLRIEAPKLLSDGAREIRLCERTTDHPRYTTFRPRCMILIEWIAPPPALAALAEAITNRIGRQAGGLDGLIGARTYPWPDRPSRKG